jgi:hypothetical protein
VLGRCYISLLVAVEDLLNRASPHARASARSRASGLVSVLNSFNVASIGQFLWSRDVFPEVSIYWLMLPILTFWLVNYLCLSRSDPEKRSSLASRYGVAVYTVATLVILWVSGSEGSPWR